MEYTKNQTVTVDITDLNNLGSGVGRLDGKVIFVPGTVDGDRAEVRIIKVTADYYVGKVERVTEPSVYRRPSPCPISDKCGGCTYMAVDYAHETELKRERVRAAFRKAGLPDTEIADVLTAGDAPYRNKICIPVFQGKLGYYAPHSHRVVEMETCELHLPVFDPILRTIRRYLARFPGDSKHFRHILLRAGETDGVTRVLVCPVVDRPLRHADELVSDLCADGAVCSVWLNYNDTEGNVILGDRFEHLWGDETVTDTLGGLRFAISPASFYQINRPAAALAYQKLLDLAGDLSGKRLLDLYCGTGTIGLYLKAHSGLDALTGVEIVPDAVENARRNAQVNGIPDAQFFCGDAHYDNGSLLKNADIVVVDPPRKGCSRELLASLTEAQIPRILYMSCDPETLARDAKILCDSGYSLSPVTPIDLFPRTGHVESVVLLSRA